MRLGGCQVIIKCNDTVMREFAPTVSKDGRRVHCWIASEPGKEFWIEYSRNLNYGPQNSELTADVSFDGKFCGGWIAPDPQPRAKKVTGEIWGSRLGKKLCHFVFSNPEIIEGETPSSVNPDTIGEIWVRLGFTEKSECVSVDQKRATVDSVPTRVNEKDKKPGAHCVTLKESEEECMGPVFYCTAPDEDALLFGFMCRTEEWLRAEGIVRKRRRQRGEPEPVEDLEPPPPPKPEPVEEVVPANEVLGRVNSEASPPPKPEPVREVVPANEVPMGGAEVTSITQPTPHPRGQENRRPTLSNSTTLERPRKISRRSGNFTFTTDGETHESTPTGTGSSHQPPAEGGSESKVKVEDSHTAKVKIEESHSVLGIGEIGGVKLEELKELLKAEEALDEQMAELRQKKDHVRDRILSALYAPRIKSEANSPGPKIKAERESTRPPSTPEVIDLTD